MNAYKKNYNNTSVCRRCHQPLDTRISRGFILKTLFFWLPVKVYFCQKCLAKRYILNPKSSTESLRAL
ncbi:MAG: hypothetical protein JO080_05785 [Mucilaginibacter sp.]|nr:hypothetical protein [Mucilaginibacter sp.]